MGWRDCLKNFLTKAGQKEDLGIYCVKLTKIENLHGFPGSGRTPAALTNKNVAEAEELILSQEQNPGTYEGQRNIGRIIGISQRSVNRICRQSLGLTAFRKTKFQDLSDADKLKRVIREKRLLRFITVANVNRTFFTEKLFKLNQTWNTQNDRVDATKKGEMWFPLVFPN